MKESDTGEMYEVKYDFKVAENGVVAIDSVSESVSSISCSTDGTVRIKLDETVLVDSLESMYPVGSVLIIRRDVFGECLMAPEVPPDETDEEKETREEAGRFLQFQDTFLLIESVAGTSRNAVISGSPSSYFGLFQEAEFEISIVDPDSVRATATRNSTDLSPTSRMRSFSLELTPQLGPVRAQTTGTLTDRGGFLGLKAKWGLTGIDIEFRFATEFEASLEVKLLLNVGVSTPAFELYELLSVPIYALPELDFFEGVKVGRFELPSFKIGFYFEIPLILQFTLELEKALGPEAKAMYNTGRKELTYFAKGPFVNIESGVRNDLSRQATSSFDFNPKFDLDTPAQVNVIVFVGLRPQLAFYVPIFSGRVSVEFGVEGKFETVLGDDNAFPPLGGGTGVATFGDCATCHKIKLTAAARVQNAGISASIGIKGKLELFGKQIDVKVQRVYRQGLPGNPAFFSDIAKGCFLKQFGENTEVCGMECCNTEESMCIDAPGQTEMCSMSPSPSPTPSPSPSNPTATPTPTSSPGASQSPDMSQSPVPSPRPSPTTQPPGRTGQVYTDPHLRTIDGLRYDCQATGEFTVVKGDSFEIQARFGGPNTRGTVTKGIAITADGTPTVQLSVALTDAPSGTLIRSCPMLLFVDGVARDIRTGTGQDDKVSVTVTGNSVRVVLENGVSVRFAVRVAGFFGCYLESFSQFIPQDIIDSETILGLMGTPNYNPDDDWTTRDGVVLDRPSNGVEAYFAKAYNYCTLNWCVRDEADSLFTYEAGTVFQEFNRCDIPYGVPPDFSTASPALRRLCGRDPACLVDGLVAGVDEAANTLRVQSELDNAFSFFASLKFQPSVIAEGTPVVVTVTLDARTVPAAQVLGLQKFAVVRVDSETGVAENALAFELIDSQGDLVFTKQTAIAASDAGEVLGFRAIPIVSGSRVNDSPLVRTALQGIRIYSAESRIGVISSETMLTISNIAGVELVAEYSWPADETDLDTATAFEGNLAGFRCGPREQYLEFGGDKKIAGGTERTIVEIDSARAQGVWTDLTEIFFRAGWHGGRNKGPATLNIFLRDVNTREKLENAELTAAITPGSQNGCADFEVARLRIEAGDEFKFTLTVNRAAPPSPTASPDPEIKNPQQTPNFEQTFRTFKKHLKRMKSSDEEKEEVLVKLRELSRKIKEVRARRNTKKTASDSQSGDIGRVNRKAQKSVRNMGPKRKARNGPQL